MPYNITQENTIHKKTRNHVLIHYLNNLLETEDLKSIRIVYHSISAKECVFTDHFSAMYSGNNDPSTIWVNVVKINEGITDFRTAYSTRIQEPKELQPYITYLKNNNKYIISMNKREGTIDIYTTQLSDELHQKIVYMLPSLYTIAEPNCKEKLEKLCQEFAEYESADTTTILKKITDYYDKAIMEYNKNAKSRAKSELVKAFKRTRKQKLEQEEIQTKNSIADFERRLVELYTQLRQTQLLQIGNEEVLNTLEDDLNQALSNNPQITLTGYKNNELEVVVKTYLTNYDPRPVKDVIRRHITSRVIGHAFEKLFSDGRYNLLIRQTISLNIEYNRFNIPSNSLSGYSNVVSYNEGLLPNAHLQYFSCFGQNTTTIEKGITNADFYTLFTALTSCVASMNFYDPGPTRRFCEAFNDMCYNLEHFEQKMIWDRDEDKHYTLPEFMQMCRVELNNEEAPELEVIE